MKEIDCNIVDSLQFVSPIVSDLMAKGYEDVIIKFWQDFDKNFTYPCFV